MTNSAGSDARSEVAGRSTLGYRVGPRRPLAVPLNVTVLRSGVPDAVPGRCLDVCEGGLGAVLAAELQAGELVGVEFRLPGSASVLAKARVCHQEKLRCGLQFVALAAEQKAALEAWAAGRPKPVSAATSAQPGLSPRPETTLPRFVGDSNSRPAQNNSRNARFVGRKVAAVLAASVVVAAAVGWWQWQQAWQELEGRLPGHSIEAVQSPVAVDWEVMQRLLVHDVAIPAPPQLRLKGVAVLTAVIGRDGSVLSLRPVSGADVLTRTAMDSVRWWKFEPYRVNGAPVEVETRLAIEFR
jgi:hypothetical protein